MKSPLIQFLLLTVACGFLLLTGLDRPVMGREQELRVVLTAREMVHGGDWLVPRYQEQVRLKKPPLTYWLVASAFALADKTYSVFVARVPGVVAGWLLVLVVYHGGALLIGRRRAFLGAVVAATSAMFLRHARLAETDVTLTLFVSLAVCCGYRAYVHRRPSFWWVLTGLCAGLGFLTKGPAALAIPVLTLAVFPAMVPAARRRSLWVHVPLALLVFLLVSTPWYVLLMLRDATQGATQAAISSEIQNTFVETAHGDSIFYYFIILPRNMLPWGVLLPFALCLAWARARRHRGMKYLLGWFAVAFVALSLTCSKQEHYALLLLPQSALLTGWWLGSRFAKRPAWVHAWASRYLPAAVSVLMILGLTAYLFIPQKATRPRELVAQFAAEAQPYIEKAACVHVAGLRANQMEYYIGEKARPAASAVKAWAAAQPGDFLVVSDDPRRPEPAEAVPAAPVLDMKIDSFQCRLYVKK